MSSRRKVLKTLSTLPLIGGVMGPSMLRAKGLDASITQPAGTHHQ